MFPVLFVLLWLLVSCVLLAAESGVGGEGGGEKVKSVCRLRPGVLSMLCRLLCSLSGIIPNPVASACTV